MSISQIFECKEVYFRTWLDFKGGFEQHLIREPTEKKYPFIFRGQGVAGWPLQTSFDRHLGRLPGTLREKTAELLSSFKRQLILARRDNDAALRQPEIWALGQHYGLPTPLLDWSTSPYIAAFFACESAASHISVKLPQEVATLDDRFAIFNIRRFGRDKQWKEMGIKFFEDYHPTNDRIRPQRGLFTFATEGGDLEQIIGSYCKRNDFELSEFLVKFTMPYSEAFAALEDLERMDITARRIYADLEGATKSATLGVRMALLSRRKLDI